MIVSTLAAERSGVHASSAWNDEPPTLTVVRNVPCPLEASRARAASTTCLSNLDPCALLQRRHVRVVDLPPSARGMMCSTVSSRGSTAVRSRSLRQIGHFTESASGLPSTEAHRSASNRKRALRLRTSISRRSVREEPGGHQQDEREQEAPPHESPDRGGQPVELVLRVLRHEAAGVPHFACRGLGIHAAPAQEKRISFAQPRGPTKGYFCPHLVHQRACSLSRLGPSRAARRFVPQRHAPTGVEHFWQNRTFVASKHLRCTNVPLTVIQKVGPECIPPPRTLAIKSGDPSSPGSDSSDRVILERCGGGGYLLFFRSQSMTSRGSGSLVPRWGGVVSGARGGS